MTGLLVRAHLDEFGARWRLVRPDETAAEALRPPRSGKVGIGYFEQFFSHHLHPDDADRFVAAARTEPDYTVTDALGLVDDVCRQLYGMPLSALLYLWGLWPTRRHVTHGRLVAGGRPTGIEGMDLYDVACLMWAETEDVATSTDLVRAPPDRVDDLHLAITGHDPRSDAPDGDDQGDGGGDGPLGGWEAPGHRRPQPSTNDSKSDVDDLRAELNRGG